MIRRLAVPALAALALLLPASASTTHGWIQNAYVASGVIPNSTWPAGSYVELDIEEVSDNYGTAAQAYTAATGVTFDGVFLNVTNSDVSWENSLLNKFKNGGY